MQGNNANRNVTIIKHLELKLESERVKYSEDIHDMQSQYSDEIHNMQIRNFNQVENNTSR